MKYKIVLVPFPFDDLSSSKVRPAVCLTDEIQPYGHVVLAFITSKTPVNPAATDFVIDSTNADFPVTGIKNFLDDSPASFDDNFKDHHSSDARRIIEKSTDGNRKSFAKTI